MWLKNLSVKLLSVIEKFVLVITTKFVDLLETIINMLIKQLSTFYGAIIMLFITIVFFELLGIRVINFDFVFDVLKNIIIIVQPIIWPISIMIILLIIIFNMSRNK